MIFDMHVHVFPDAIATRASAGIASFYDLPVRYDGRLRTLFELGQRAGISRYLIHSVATVPTQVKTINNYIAECVKAHPDELVGFATVHPDQPDMEEEIDRAVEIGLRGIKIHPDIQRVDLDDPRLYRLYRAIENRLPLLSHTGDMRYDYSHPRRMAKVVDDFPDMTIICAHLGGWMRWDESLEYLAGKDVYVDTCSSLYALDREKAVTLIRAFGADRVLFGTDYPMWQPEEELNRFHDLNLSPEEEQAILWDNAEKILGEGTPKAKSGSSAS